MENKKVLSYMSATGRVDYNMTNNYMFRYILQKNQKVLKGLICALLHLEPEEVKKYKIDYWAAIFKAKTWEEIKLLAKENEYLQEAAESLYVANADEIVRQQCIAREDAERIAEQREAELIKEVERLKALLENAQSK